MKKLIPVALVAAILILTWFSGKPAIAYGVAAAFAVVGAIYFAYNRHLQKKVATIVEILSAEAAKKAEAGVKSAVQLFKQGDEFVAAKKYDEAIASYTRAKELIIEARGPHNGIAFLIDVQIRQVEETRRKSTKAKR